MLLGEFNHNIDEKGRLIIPAKLREDLGDSFVICNGLEGCLFVYSQEEWNKFVAELESLPRMNKDAVIFKRYFFGSASEGSFDKQGRVLVPPSLRKNAHPEKEVVLVGVQDRVEIWDKALWEEKTGSARKIRMRLQNVWKRSEFASDDNKDRQVRQSEGGVYGIRARFSAVA